MVESPDAHRAPKDVSDSFSGSNLEEDLYRKNEAKNWWFALGEGRWGVRVNPVSFIASVCLIWGFAIWAMVKADVAAEGLEDAQAWVTDTFTWAYMATQQFWVLFLAVVFFSRLGTIKLGKPEDEPEFPTASWFMMLFSAGVGIGLFFFGVAEPVWHYEPCYGEPFAGPEGGCHGNRYAELPDDERAQWAINLTYFHWGFHAWIAYVIVGLLLGTAVYRKGLPMTMKSAFYPVLGDKIFGWMGDLIDVISVATTLFGVCTTLGLGVQQINAGLTRLNSSIPQSTTTQVRSPQATKHTSMPMITLAGAQGTPILALTGPVESPHSAPLHLYLAAVAHVGRGYTPWWIHPLVKGRGAIPLSVPRRVVPR